MIEEDREEQPEEQGATNVTSEGMAEALDAVKAASPSLAGAIDAGITPDELADAHDAATPDEGNYQRSQPTDTTTA